MTFSSVSRPVAGGLLLLAALVGTVGCSSVYSASKPFLGVPALPPSDPKLVQIIARDPDRPFERLGEVYVTVGDDAKRPEVEAALRKEVAALGGDVAIVTQDQMAILNVVNYDFHGFAYVSPQASRQIVAVAAKLK